MSEDVRIVIKGDATSAIGAFTQVRGAASAAVSSLQLSSSAMLGGFTKLASFLPQVSGLLAGLSLASMVSEAMQLADALDEMSERTGVAVEDLAGLDYVAKMNGMSLSDMGTIMRDLNRSISEVGRGNKETTELFSKLGVSVTDSSGRLRGAYDVLLDLADVFPRLNQADQVAVSLALLGRQGSALVPALAGGRVALEEMISKGRELNPVTAELAKSVGEFNDNVDRAAMSLRSLVLPALQEVVPWLNKMSAEMREGLRVFGSFSGAMVAILGVNPFRSQAEQVAALKEELASLAGDRERYVRAGSDTRAIDEAIAFAQKKLDYFKSIQASLNPDAGGGRGFSNPASVAPKLISLGDPNAGAKAAKAAAAEATKAANELRQRQRDAFEDRVGQLRLELAKWKNNTEEQRRIAQRVADEAGVMFGAKSKEYAAAQQELVRIDQRAAEQRKQIEEQLRTGQLNAALAVVEEERAQADHRMALGFANMEQRLAQESEFERRAFEIKRAAMAAKELLLLDDKDNNPVELARVKQEIEELEREHQARMGEIKRGQNAERAGPGGAVAGSIERDLASSTTAMLTQQATAMESLKGLWRSTSSTFVDEMISKPLAAWITGQARMTLATILGINTRTAAEATGAAAAEGLTAASVIKIIAMKAWQAAASVYASIAAIPVIGPVLAPVMAGVAVGAVMAMASNVFSAAGGFDIPAGVNPMVQAHAKEMILPAKYADVIRGLADGGGGGGGGDTFAPVIHAMDGKSVQAFFRGPGGDAVFREWSMRRRSNRSG